MTVTVFHNYFQCDYIETAHEDDLHVHVYLEKQIQLYTDLVLCGSMFNRLCVNQ